MRYLLTQDDTHDFDPQARTWLVEDAKAGEPEAMLLLGNLYAKGVGVSQNYRQALTWFKSAVNKSPDDVNIVNEVAWTLAVTHLEPSAQAQLCARDHGSRDEGRRSRAQESRLSRHVGGGVRREWQFHARGRVAAAGRRCRAEQEESAVVEVLQAHLDAFQRGETVIDPVP